ncbi:MAG TPA: hypothetical protein ENI86_11360 [Acidimicrobiales bacterium]|nr:hypothetical protein [Acidimicrobiales bacterium]
MSAGSGRRGPLRLGSVVGALIGVLAGVTLLVVGFQLLAASFGSEGLISEGDANWGVEQLRRGWSGGAEILAGITLAIVGLVALFVTLPGREHLDLTAGSIPAPSVEGVRTVVTRRGVEGLLTAAAKALSGAERVRVRVGRRGRVGIRLVIENERVEPDLAARMGDALDLVCEERSLPCRIKRVEVAYLSPKRRRRVR